MRLFLAIDLAPSVRHAWVAALAVLREAFAAAVRRSAPDVIHLTVKFLGERAKDNIDRRLERVGGRIRGRQRFAAHLTSAGASSTAARPRVLGCGVGPNPLVRSLYQVVERAAADVGFAAEDRAFRPRVTVGRVRRPLAPVGPRRLVDALQAANLDETYLVESIDLMRSQLSCEGARYERFWRACLADAARRVPTEAR